MPTSAATESPIGGGGGASGGGKGTKEKRGRDVGRDSRQDMR